MTTDVTVAVAVAVAVACAVLAVILLVVVVRQSRLTRSLSTQLADVLGAQAASSARLEQLAAEQQASVHALEQARQAAAVAAAPAPETAEDVTVITDISERLRGIDGEGEDVTTGRIASVTLGGPLIKVAAFSHGIRHALDEEQRMRISYAVRKELRRQRKIRRRRHPDQAPSKGWG